MNLLAHQARLMAGSGVDPYWPNVEALLKFNGANGSTAVVDETGRPWTRTSNFQLSNAYAFFPAESPVAGWFNGGYAETVPNSDLHFGSDDYTLELWIRPTSLPNTGLVDMRGNIGSSARPCLYIASSILRCQWSGADRITSLAILSATTNYHVVQQRRAGKTRLFINGVLQGTSLAMTGWTSGNDGIRIGRTQYAYGSNMAGYVDEFRLTRGIARYPDGGFTPPSEPFQAS